MIPVTGRHVDLSLLHPRFKERLEKFFSDERIDGRVVVLSGCRSYAAQKRLYDKYRAGKGNLAANPDWQRPDGFFRGSFHQEQPDGWSYAVDFRITTRGGSIPVITQVADEYGMRPTVRGEWWHFQPRDAEGWFSCKAFKDKKKKPVMDWAGIIAYLLSVGREIGLCPLQKGSRGTAVEVVQKRLNAIDFWCGTVDGKFGRKTANAVKQLQRAVLLPVDGKVGIPVWKAMWDPKVPYGL